MEEHMQLCLNRRRYGVFSDGEVGEINDTLLLYTDGVTEAASVQKELYWEGRLKTVAEKENARTPEQFDDITMIGLTYHGTVYGKKTGIPDIDHIREFADFVENTLMEKQISMQTILKVQMAVDEIFSNICYYSGAKEITIGIAVQDTPSEDGKMQEREICLYFEDDGIPYNPLEQPEPDVKELLEERKKGGLGIYLVKKRMDWMGYKYTEEKNHLICRKKDVWCGKENRKDAVSVAKRKE